MTVREIINFLTDDGGVFKNQKGSHMYFTHPSKRGKITVPIHNGDIKKKTAHTILKQAGLK